MIEQQQESNKCANSIFNATQNQVSVLKMKYPPETVHESKSVFDSEWENEDGIYLQSYSLCQYKYYSSYCHEKWLFP